MTSNADGTKLYASSYSGGTADQYIFASTNGGTSFFPTHASGERRAWWNIDTDDVGTKLLATAGTSVYASVDSGATFVVSHNMGASPNASPRVALAGNGLRAVAGDVTARTTPNVAGLQTAECDATLACTWTQLVAGGDNWIAFDMNADGTRFVAAIAGGVQGSSLRTYTFGVPTAGQWNLVASWKNPVTTNTFSGVAISDNAAAVYYGNLNDGFGVGNGQFSQ